MADFNIEKHMEVTDASGAHVGTVDHYDGDQLKLTRKDSTDGQHHYVPLSDVETVEGNQVTLKQGASLTTA